MLTLSLTFLMLGQWSLSDFHTTNEKIRQHKCDSVNTENSVFVWFSFLTYKRELTPSAFHFNQRSRGSRRYCHLFILHMVFLPHMDLS